MEAFCEFALSLDGEALLVSVEAFALKTDALGPEMAAEKAGDVGGDLPEAGPAGQGFGFGGEKGAGSGGVLEGDPMGELFGKAIGERRVGGLVLVLDALGEVAGIEADKPVAVAAVFPFGEVALGNRAAGELFVEKGFDLGQGVEPLENGFAKFAVLKAAVELLTDGVRETSDFSSSSHKFSRWLRVDGYA